jgi:AcrR family transcriptional regulator
VTAQGPRRAGRRAGETRTREAILDAARRSFAAHGYDGATIRGIAAGAGVNPALVHHFYGTKEGLFAAAMQLPVRPGEILTRAFSNARDRLGEDFEAHVGEITVATMLRAWETAEVRAAFLGLLRTAATTDQGLIMLREFVTSAILASLVRAAGLADDADGRYRAALAGSQVVGLGFTRYLLRLEPIASASPEDLVVAIGPAVQRYLSGDLSR